MRCETQATNRSRAALGRCNRSELGPSSAVNLATRSRRSLSLPPCVLLVRPRHRCRTRPPAHLAAHRRHMHEHAGDGPGERWLRPRSRHRGLAGHASRPGHRRRRSHRGRTDGRARDRFEHRGRPGPRRDRDDRVDRSGGRAYPRSGTARIHASCGSSSSPAWADVFAWPPMPGAPGQPARGNVLPARPGRGRRLASGPSRRLRNAAVAAILNSEHDAARGHVGSWHDQQGHQ